MDGPTIGKFVTCPGGTYAKPGSTECYNCTAGASSAQGERCLECLPGYSMMNGRCDICHGGYDSEGENAVCEICPEMTWSYQRK